MKLFENFKIKANKIHNNKYDYSLVDYKNCYNEIIIICPIHKQFTQQPRVHLSGSGCQKCYFQKNKDDLNDFIEKAQLKHLEKFNYTKVKYIDTYTKIIIICNNCNNDFLQRPNAHLNGQGCPRCCNNSSKPENEWLDYLKIPNLYRQQYLNLNNKRFYLDALDKENKIIYEFNGDFYHR